VREREKMEYIEQPIMFTCPDCKKSFEFDPVGEYQLVSCPICGIEYITVKEKQTLILQYFEQVEVGCNQ
jgi:Zn finger protein HypA/HybF involved in hydrogenase expression